MKNIFIHFSTLFVPLLFNLYFLKWFLVFVSNSKYQNHIAYDLSKTSVADILVILLISIIGVIKNKENKVKKWVKVLLYRLIILAVVGSLLSIVFIKIN
ncbi:MAG: hypothetical protein N4A33_09100 [Bacteriovoracaceae bacterium]|jgi:predicted membrane channel-forming protein YqfA (hemolysin III family)|nr:hypothetical protein [Bacteriovoracaceae bacterium]